MDAKNLLNVATRLMNVAESVAPVEMNLADHERVLGRLCEAHANLALTLSVNAKCIRWTSRRKASEGDTHVVGDIRHALDRAGLKVPRALCGASLVADPAEPLHPTQSLTDPMCPQCAGDELAALVKVTVASQALVRRAVGNLNSAHSEMRKICRRRREVDADLRAANHTPLYRASCEMAAELRLAGASLGTYAGRGFKYPQDHLLVVEDLAQVMRPLGRALRGEALRLGDEGVRYARQIGDRRLARAVDKQAEAVNAASRAVDKARQRVATGAIASTLEPTRH